MAGRRWRRWNAAIHRDLGYLCAGLTLVYAVSGVAVNHRGDWNPNYRTTERTVALDGDVASGDLRDPAVVAALLARLGVDRASRGTFRPDPNTLEIFLGEGASVSVDLVARTATFESVQDRTGLRQANFLHLNQGKGLWTWMADVYAVALALLAVTGLFVLRGRNGITGRGAWLTVAGVAVPALFLLFFF
jgi:hypothetical protein